jgi:hypothetical protein
VLRLPKPSILERYTNVFFAFTLSGIYHVVYSRARGRIDHDVGTMLFFQAFPFVIMFEDGVQAIARQISGVTRETEVTPLWKKLVGYIWVTIILATLSPWMLFSTSRIAHHEQWMLPYSIIDQVGIQLVGIMLAVGGLLNYFIFKPEI